MSCWFVRHIMMHVQQCRELIPQVETLPESEKEDLCKINNMELQCDEHNCISNLYSQ